MSKSKCPALHRGVMCALLCLMIWPISLQAAGRTGNRASSGETEKLYIKAHFKAPVKRSALKSGDTLEGELSEAVYSGAQEVFPAGSRVRMTRS